MGDLFNQKGAIFSDCRLYRYQLWRIWDPSKPYINVIGLNPSTADEVSDDPTIRRCIDFAFRWGYGALYMTNLFAFRATLPKDMKRASDPIGPDNDQWIHKTALNAGKVIAAWGNHGTYLHRDQFVCALVRNLYCFRITSKTAMPEHPLYLPKTVEPVQFQIK
jgi:hypothetical protein